MKTTKMSLASIKGKLGRAEMKKIMAGSGTCDPATCAAKSNDDVGQCVCTQAGQCVCVK